MLERALAPDPETRWTGAKEFRQHLWHTRIIQYRWRAAALTAAGLTGGVLLTVLSNRFVEGRFDSEGVVLVMADHTRGSDSSVGLADSATEFLLARLRLYPDFRACGPDEGCGQPQTTLLVSAEAQGSQLTIATRSREDATAIFAVGTSDSFGAWRDAADRMLTQLFLQLWQRKTPDLPVKALPSDDRSMLEFIEAERLWHEASWIGAGDAYLRAAAIDPTCYLCSWRYVNVQRWFQEPMDTVHLERVLDNIGLFTTNYQLLIEARTSPVDKRLEILERVTETENGFFLAYFELGDELLNRGALVGQVLERSSDVLFAAATRRPTFEPAWEQLVWANLVLRDVPGATAAWAHLDSLDRKSVV